MSDDTNENLKPSLEEEVANLRTEYDQLYESLKSEAIAAQLESDLHEEKRRLKHGIAAMKRGDFPGPPPSEDYDDDDA